MGTAVSPPSTARATPSPFGAFGVAEFASLLLPASLVLAALVALGAGNAFKVETGVSSPNGYNQQPPPTANMAAIVTTITRGDMIELPLACSFLAVALEAVAAGVPGAALVAAGLSVASGRLTTLSAAAVWPLFSAARRILARRASAIKSWRIRSGPCATSRTSLTGSASRALARLGECDAMRSSS